MHVEHHFAARCIDVQIVGPACQMQVALRFNLRGVAVPNHFVGLQNVVAVVKDNIAGEGERIAGPVLMRCLPLNRGACGRRGFRLSDREDLLARIPGDWVVPGWIIRDRIVRVRNDCGRAIRCRTVVSVHARCF